MHHTLMHTTLMYTFVNKYLCKSDVKNSCDIDIHGLSNLHSRSSVFRGKQILNLKGHCIEFKYYADVIHSGLTPPGNNS